MIYEYEGNKYMVILDKNVQMKDPRTGCWIAAVVYVKYKKGIDPQGANAQTYIRMKADFEHKFDRL